MENDAKSGRQAVAPMPEDEPRCPYCSAPMAVKTRRSSEGWVSQYYCIICHARAPAVCMEAATEDIMAAAKLVANSRILGGQQVATPTPQVGSTNGDKIRSVCTLADRELAKILWKIPDSTEMLPFCRELPECQEMAEGIEPIPASKCMQCLIHWLGQPAKEGVWKD